MTTTSDTTTALVRDDTFWRPDQDATPQDWLGYLGLEDDPEECAIESPTADAASPGSANPYEALAPPTDDLLPGR